MMSINDVDLSQNTYFINPFKGHTVWLCEYELEKVLVGEVLFFSVFALDPEITNGACAL